jgi:hypothetical protein
VRSQAALICRCFCSAKLPYPIPTFPPPKPGNGDVWIRFNIHPLQRNDALVLPCACRASDYRWVTNSGGGRERRFVIETPVRIGELTWPIEVTLTSRDQMGFRMLLGRTAIRKRFVVDPARSYCTTRMPKRKKKQPRAGALPAAGLSSNED